MTETKQVDVLIAGQGAAAFAAGLYSARYQVNTLLVVNNSVVRRPSVEPSKTIQASQT